MDRPLILVTMGDPAGVGPRVCLEALAKSRRLLSRYRVVLFGDARALDREAGHLSSVPPFEVIGPPPWPEAPEPRRGAIAVACPSAARGALPPPGRPSAASGRAQIAFVDAALDALAAGQARALVTGPVSKAAITRAGVPFSGHTEHLARAAGVAEDAVTMLFAGPTVRVALVTTHLALREVPGAVTQDRIVGTIRRVALGLRELLGIPEPRLVVLGLNPHAGEEGLLGDEEMRVLRPALRRARRLAACRGVEITGPVPTETGLRQTVAGRFDCAVALYHDQATLPCKLLDMGRSVNVTLGLPFTRTSVDHGVAYDAAEAGTASCGSMRAALALAAQSLEPGR